MSLMNKIIGDNLHLKGPNVSKAPACMVDLSGTTLYLPTPKQTLMIQTEVQQTRFDIYNLDLFYKWERDQNSMSLDIHRNGWELKGRLGRSIGYMCLNVQLIKVREQKESSNFFNPNNLKAWLLRYAEESWGESNQRKIEEHHGKAPKKYLWTYPLSDEHLFNICQKEEGFYFYTSRPSEGLTTSYWIPISKGHVLLFNFVSNPIDCDFYSPEHNLPEATEQFIQEFMRNVKITSSPEALVEKLMAQ